jgi:hypothetical protein
LINTNVATTNVANTNVAGTTILRGGSYPVAAAPGTAATAGAVAAGTAAVATGVTAPRAYTTAVAALPCDPHLLWVNDITYYRCDSTWYTRSYVDGNIAYVVNNPPG